MNAHALAVLQFASVLDVVAGYASSSLGAARVRALAPATSRERVERELSRVAAMRAIVSCDEGWSRPIPDVDRALARLRIEGHGSTVASCNRPVSSSARRA
jgi:dsDNA-specific endonuclease/ATPase MutS2